MITRIVRCADCRTELPECENVARDRRLPCPACGSLNRLLEVETQGLIPVDEPVRPAASASEPAPTPQRASNRTRRRSPVSRISQAVKVTRRFDLDRGTYWECVEREHDGIVIRQLEQPLSDHFSALASADHEANHEECVPLDPRAD